MAERARTEILNRIEKALGRRGKSMPIDSQPDLSANPSLVGEIEARCRENRPQLITQFESELKKVGGSFCVVSQSELCRYVKELVLSHKAKTAITWHSPILEEVGIAKMLEADGVQVMIDDGTEAFTARAVEADVGVSGTDYALADTGTLILLSGRGKARSVSLVAPLHIAILKPEQVLSGLDDLFPLLRLKAGNEAEVPSSAITFITGPSRTADIEMTLVVGVHGPQQLHVLLLED